MKRILTGTAALATFASAALLVFFYKQIHAPTATAAVQAGAAKTKDVHEKGTRITYPGRSIYRSENIAMTATPFLGAGAVHVAAEIKLTDFELGAHYAWMVRLVPEDSGHRLNEYGDPKFENIYLNQVFQVTPEVENVYKFDDLVQPAVPIGKYQVEVGLVRLPPGMTGDMVKSNKHAWNLTTGKGSRPIELK